MVDPPCLLALMLMISFSSLVNLLLHDWPAFAGVSNRWVESYYQDLVAPETNIRVNELETCFWTIVVGQPVQRNGDREGHY